MIFEVMTVRDEENNEYTGEGKEQEEDKEEDLYEEEERDKLEEDDEISPEEEGFMKGYEEGKKMSRCAKCGKVLLEDFVEREVRDEICRFCSDSCAEKYK